MSAPVGRYDEAQFYGALALRVGAVIILVAAFSAGMTWGAGASAAASSEMPPSVDDSWSSEVHQRVQASEYEITWQERTVLADLDRAWHAPNRAHNLRTYFTEEGIRVVRRTESEPSWEFSLSLVGYGRGGSASSVGDAALSAYENRIDYDRGRIVEWYLNEPRGLEQGFTLAGPPAVPHAGEETAPAFLVLAIGGSLSPVISEDGQAIDFASPGGAKVLHYAKLNVTDARGRELPAWMEGCAEAGVRGIRIVFDDADATYPLVVDPLLTSPAWTAEGDQANTAFGVSVSTAGDVNGDGYSDVVVGGYGYDNGEVDEGRAYVYHGSAAGLSAIPDWTVESDQASALFGNHVSTAGDVNGDGYADVIVGAVSYESGAGGVGAAYLYHGSAAGLSATPDWTAEGDQTGAYFGCSLSTAGDVNGDGYADVIVGAQYYENGDSHEGRAYLYHGSAAGLSAAPDWTAEGNQAPAGFGGSVSTAGDVNGDGYSDVIVGAANYDNGEAYEGRAFLYHGSAAGLDATPAWIAESDQVNANFGHSVSTAGDVNGDGYADVIVGAYLYDNGEWTEGRTYVYHGSAVGLGSTPDWIAESNQTEDWFGRSVSTAGDVDGDGYADVIIGAAEYGNGSGRTFVYHGSAGGLSETAGWLVVSDQLNAEFGGSVSTAGDVNGDGYADVIVGASRYTNGEFGEGRAYVYHGAAGGLSDAEGWTDEGDQIDANFGFSVSTAGDVNGDGYAEVIVGAYSYDNGEMDEGRVSVYHGSASGISATPDWTAEGDQIGVWFGFSVSTAGDVNGDGYADVIVGAALYSNGEAGEGRALAYIGSAAGLGSTPYWTAESDQAFAAFGESVSTAGDVNGDGYADVIVGARQYENGETNEGRAYAYHGSAAGLSASPDWIVESDQSDAQFGKSVSTAGDVNGDGYADVIVGAWSYDNGESGEGGAFAYHGSAIGLSATPDWVAEGDQAQADFGESVSMAGDVNGDGYTDVIVGAAVYDNGESSEGRASVYHGSASGLSTTPDWTAESNQVGARFGKSVSTAGDVNGDGYADVVVGAFSYDNDETGEGRAFTYHGSAAGLSATPDWTAESDQQNPYFGISVSTAGDVNGDGYTDVIVGAPRYDNDDSNEGRVWLYYGNDGPGLSLEPQQRRADDLAPIAPGGRSHAPGSYRLAVVGRSPFGRGRVRLEWEAESFGQPFDGSGTGQSVWFDSGTAGVAINELIAGLEPGGQHWRLRLLYDPVTTPFAQKSRWFSAPWNGWEEWDLIVGPFVGGQIWEDRDGDGIMETHEPRLSGVAVDLLDDTGAMLDGTVTGGDGSYRFEIASGQGSVKVRFVVPSGWRLTAQDQGVDDLVDSDADRVTGETVLIMPPLDALDDERWSAGLRRVGICTPPDEPVYIYAVTLTTDGNAYPVLHFQDPNQPGSVTGYNIYRSSEPGLPHSQWPSIADDVYDMDASEPNHQWVDTSGDESPSESWYYLVAPYNHECPEETAEGPW